MKTEVQYFPVYIMRPAVGTRYCFAAGAGVPVRIPTRRESEKLECVGKHEEYSIREALDGPPVLDNSSETSFRGQRSRITGLDWIIPTAVSIVFILA